MGSGEMCLLATLEVSEVRPQLRRSWVICQRNHQQRLCGTTPRPGTLHQSGWPWGISCLQSWSWLGSQQQSSGVGLGRTSLCNLSGASQALLLFGRISVVGWTMPFRSHQVLHPSRPDASRLQHLGNPCPHLMAYD